eukprot:TRINITY_DN6608_c0_g1_i1.p1 TRINITY_DN6608_c0_g1~~TRINITY_DN6608_c0_g1_i1.p1  ORF type:complete len:429 (-),score=141.17 TRINITY_DN6608_c0_g1_i1:40-1326(-)
MATTANPTNNVLAATTTTATTSSSSSSDTSRANIDKINMKRLAEKDRIRKHIRETLKNSNNINKSNKNANNNKTTTTTTANPKNNTANNRMKPQPPTVSASSPSSNNSSSMEVDDPANNIRITINVNNKEKEITAMDTNVNSNNPNKKRKRVEEQQQQQQQQTQNGDITSSNLHRTKRMKSSSSPPTTTAPTNKNINTSSTVVITPAAAAATAASKAASAPALDTSRDLPPRVDSIESRTQARLASGSLSNTFTTSSSSSSMSLGSSSNAQRRCKNFPFCDAKPISSCPYYHPTEECKNILTCKFGPTACRFIHPPCKFLNACIRPNCAYSHPAEAKINCKNGFSCSARIKSQCPYKHPLEACLYSSSCRHRETCRFSHEAICNKGTSCSDPGCKFAHKTTEYEEEIVIDSLSLSLPKTPPRSEAASS